MTMKIIALTGRSSSGKTTILNLAYDMLIRDGAVSTNRQQLGGNPQDFSDILYWKNIRVAFYTMGDFSRLLSAAIFEYTELSCDLLICACNDKFSGPLKLFRRYNAEILHITREADHLRAGSNMAVAEQIRRLADEAAEIPATSPLL
jgi:energy-coupling factor transporter ATP-binding protein EcfA2